MTFLVGTILLNSTYRFQTRFIDRLHKSWSGIKAAEATQKDFGSGQEWVVTFKNPKAEANKQTVYVFYTLTGTYMATNFTGQ